jgi:hypothetical protein
VSAVCVFVAVFEMGCKAFLQDGVHVDADFGLLAPYAGGGEVAVGFVDLCTAGR